MTAMRHVPVDRAAPAAAYLRARSLLREGEAVGIFPEAGVSTSYTVRALMPGAVALARETGAPLLPMAIWGPQRILTAERPVDLRRGPAGVAAGRRARCTSVPTTDAAARRAAARGHACSGCSTSLQRRPVHQPRAGEHAPWHPAHLGGQAPEAGGRAARGERPGRARSRRRGCRRAPAAGGRRARPAALPGSRPGRRPGVSRRATGGRAEQQRDRDGARRSTARERGDRVAAPPSPGTTYSATSFTTKPWNR